MALSKEWEQTYRNSQQISVYPWSDLVIYVMRYAKPSKDFRVLELGFGSGANISFFKNLGAKYCGIEGSATMASKMQALYPEFELVAGDFSKEIPFEGEFDLIFDRSSITHNDTAGIKSTIKLIHSRLKKGGKFIGIDWFGLAHSCFDEPGELLDAHSKIFSSGYFSGLGAVHFCDERELRELFKDFRIRKMEVKTNTDLTKEDEKMPNERAIKTLNAYNFVAEKM